MEGQEKAPSTDSTSASATLVPGDEEEDEISVAPSDFSGSVYSDDDSAALFAEDSQDESPKLIDPNGSSPEGDDEWMDDDIRKSSQLIYGIMTLLCLATVIVAATTSHYASNESNKEYELAVSA